MTVVTRFPPSPTGFLHIGSARTALFNWLYARKMGGKFLLRIEDTDRERSTDAAVAAIFEGMKWLELNWDNEKVPMQFDQRGRHAEVAHELLKKGLAYHCYCSPEELEAMRTEQKAKGLPMRYDGRWRDRDAKDAPSGVKPVVRLKASQEGATVVKDHVRGEVTVQNAQLDDMILLRADGTPTYMLSVVVDDYDMAVTHVIRGDDHFTNTFRQVQIIKAMGWKVPEYAHIPLINGPDGAKLSKRHGALGVSAYRDMGYLPEAMRNYLLRLGWSHGDDEIISTEQAIEWFDLEHIQSSPARFDFTKLDSVNAHYMRKLGDLELADKVLPYLKNLIEIEITEESLDMLRRAIPDLKDRVKTLKEMAEGLVFYFQEKAPVDAKAERALNQPGYIKAAKTDLSQLNSFIALDIETTLRGTATKENITLKDLVQPLRVAVSGSTVSPPLFKAMEILGKEEVIRRLDKADKTKP